MFLKRKQKLGLHNINAEKKDDQKQEIKERNRKGFTNKDGFDKADTKWRNTKENEIVGHLPLGKGGKFAKPVFYFLRADEYGSCNVLTLSKKVRDSRKFDIAHLRDSESRLY